MLSTKLAKTACRCTTSSGLSRRAAGIATESAEIDRVSQNTANFESKAGCKIHKLLKAFEDNDDIQNVTANFSMPEDVMQEVLETGT